MRRQVYMCSADYASPIRPTGLLQIRPEETTYGDCLMIVSFFDVQDGTNPLNGSTYADSSSLLDCLRLLSSRPPFFCEIEGEDGFKLLVGIGGKWSCIQHSAVDGSPPYLIALPREEQFGVQGME